MISKQHKSLYTLILISVWQSHTATEATVYLYQHNPSLDRNGVDL
jgi:hypothetical protein